MRGSVVGSESLVEVMALFDCAVVLWDAGKEMLYGISLCGYGFGCVCCA